ncbi:uncharacterized protein C8Q71DRAFT_723786 [Rhodofomes roseus]|uniref:Uncharacterized protein n=1 Tax=Rhodofomes roseus TaxID=34475 RepID=A0ABQ8KFW8_9APHY|nr:uncharacterized protein C8Q71DRAFT_723786 [Rhodofomes roseus]KAH9836668.1 hypothetical protein C8Q71DRAFT_723786 [Rhodofomes roseus]
MLFEPQEQTKLRWKCAKAKDNNADRLDEDLKNHWQEEQECALHAEQTCLEDDAHTFIERCDRHPRNIGTEVNGHAQVHRVSGANQASDTSRPTGEIIDITQEADNSDCPSRCHPQSLSGITDNTVTRPCKRRRLDVCNDDVIDLTQDHQSEVSLIWAYLEDSTNPMHYTFDNLKNTRRPSSLIFTRWGLGLTDPISMWKSAEQKWTFMHVEKAVDLPYSLCANESLVWCKWRVQELRKLDLVTDSNDAEGPRWPTEDSLWHVQVTST